MQFLTVNTCGLKSKLLFLSFVTLFLNMTLLVCKKPNQILWTVLKYQATLCILNIERTCQSENLRVAESKWGNFWTAGGNCFISVLLINLAYKTQLSNFISVLDTDSKLDIWFKFSN